MKNNIISPKLQKELFKHLNKAMNELGENEHLNQLFHLIWDADNK